MPAIAAQTIGDRTLDDLWDRPLALDFFADACNGEFEQKTLPEDEIGHVRAFVMPEQQTRLD